MSFLAPDPFPNWRKALAAAKAGTTRAVIACMGDSTTAGWYGGTPTGSSSAPLSGNAKAGSWPSQVAAMFVAGGLPFAGKQIFGDHNANSVTPTPVSAALTGYDSTLTMSTDWTVPSTTAASTCLGGHFLVGAVNTTTTIGFTDTVLDTCDVYYPINTIALDPAMPVSIGGSVVGTLAEGGQPAVSFGMAHFTGTAGSVLINQGGNSTGAGYLIGLDAYTAANKGVALFNMGWGSSATTDWAGNSTNLYNVTPSISYVPASLWIISLGINDYQNGVAVPAYMANLQFLVNAATARGADVMFVVQNRTSTTLTPQATQELYASAMKRVAAMNNIRVLDIATLANFSTWSTANAASLMGDTRHPNAAGYAEIATAIFNIVANP